MIYKNKILVLFSIILFISLFNGLIFAASDTNTCDANQVNVVGTGTCSIDLNIHTPDNLVTSNPTQFVGSSIGDLVCGVYFTKIGCPHCAKVDPVLFGDLVRNKNIAIIEYEVADKAGNAQQIIPYVTGGYKSSYLVPQLILNKQEVFFSEEIIPKFNTFLESNNTNLCSLPANIYADGDTNFSNLKINELSGLPTIWYKDRALYKYSNSNLTDDQLKKLLTDTNVDSIILEVNHKSLTETSIQISENKIKFDNAVELNGYYFYWNGKTTISAVCDTIDVNKVTDVNKDCNTTQNTIDTNAKSNKVSLITAISLAFVDALNPCELAMLLLVLLTIMTSNPGNKRKVLYAGLMYSLAVFVMYFIFGLLLINLFKLIPGIDTVRIIVTKAVAIFAIILAILQLKDFFNYRPGTIGTEMPLSLRPKVQKLISKVTSPWGAFTVGAVVTLFLLPCAIGPYVILGNLLSTGYIASAIPILLLYNFIFVIPTLIITFIVYGGIVEVQRVGEWKKNNTRYLHLGAGIILLVLGALILLGII